MQKPSHTLEVLDIYAQAVYAGRFSRMPISRALHMTPETAESRWYAELKRAAAKGAAFDWKTKLATLVRTYIGNPLAKEKLLALVWHVSRLFFEGVESLRLSMAISCAYVELKLKTGVACPELESFSKLKLTESTPQIKEKPAGATSSNSINADDPPYAFLGLEEQQDFYGF